MRELIGALILGGGLAWPAARASGQYELGAGNALDANPLRDSTGYNTAKPLPDFRSRNLLVTGNVVGGRGFRGTVGYSAQFDFRGETGADELYLERANSAYSAPNFISGGRSMELLRFGQFLNEVEYFKATRGAASGRAEFQPYVPEGVGESNRIALDRVAISSTTSAIYESAADARIVGLVQDENGRQLSASASSLLGVRITPVEQQVQLIGLTTLDLMRTLEDIETGREVTRLGEPFEASYERLDGTARRGEAPASGRLETEVESARIEPTLSSSYLGIMERVAQRYGEQVTGEEEAEAEATDGAMLTQLDEQMETVRRQLAELHPPPEEAAAGEGEPRAEAGETAAETAEDIARMAGPLRHGEYVQQLTDEEATRFQELLASAEEALAEGEYFWAERRFDRALRFTPGHPLATAGKGHAQAGAGLYAPAALTLRRLLAKHPEMIDVRYGPALLPNRVRMTTAVQRLREMIEQFERDRELRGFLLAYLGHQLDDRAVIAEGLEAMGEEPLRGLLESIWLEEDQ